MVSELIAALRERDALRVHCDALLKEREAFKAEIVRLKRELAEMRRVPRAFYATDKGWEAIQRLLDEDELRLKTRQNLEDGT